MAPVSQELHNTIRRQRKVGEAPENTTFITSRIIRNLNIQKDREVTIQDIVNFVSDSYGTGQAILTSERSPFSNRGRNLVRIAERGRHALRKGTFKELSKGSRRGGAL